MTANFPYWGIDGCKSGWFCVGLNGDGGFRFFVAPCIAAVYEKLAEFGAKIALIDIPIGLTKNEKARECEYVAEKLVGDRYHSVFYSPCRAALDAFRAGGDHAKVKMVNKDFTGDKLSIQAFSIMRKIAEVDDFLQSGKTRKIKLREVHPEVCFCALNGFLSLKYGKNKSAGKTERREILAKYLSDVESVESKIRRKYLKGQVADDDILDALAAAVTAKLGYPDKYQTLPENSQYEILSEKPPMKLPMEMVFAGGKQK